ncbi:AtpZ/AtpI family protein [Pedobacter namyangjuensis]|uniref:AtpZ/AtpI family protein n=1 Tax=Pedobacter namyangjuensis TaxID=600626 RepID=UPI000DE51FCA|nr:AtpZ/AtpI family protein [Pedobacter namyangjuensis]
MGGLGSDKAKRETTNFVKYTGVAFQMLATIGLFVFLGYKIDGYRNSTTLIFTALLGLLGVIISLVQLIRSLNKPRK